MSELLVLKDYQGKGYGRYLLNKAVRQMKRGFPKKAIRLYTCREWVRSRCLAESYGFVPVRMYTNLNLPKLPG